MAKAVITLALEAEQIVRIASEAKRRGKSTSGFASELLEKALGLLGEASPTEEDKRAAVVEELLRSRHGFKEH